MYLFLVRLMPRFSSSVPFILQYFACCVGTSLRSKNVLEWYLSAKCEYSFKLQSVNMVLNYISNNDKKHHTQTIFLINMMICSIIYKTKKESYISGLDKLCSQWWGCTQCARKEVFVCTKLRARKSIKTPLKADSRVWNNFWQLNL